MLWLNFLHRITIYVLNEIDIQSTTECGCVIQPLNGIFPRHLLNWTIFSFYGFPLGGSARYYFSALLGHRFKWLASKSSRKWYVDRVQATDWTGCVNTGWLMPWSNDEVQTFLFWGREGDGATRSKKVFQVSELKTGRRPPMDIKTVSKEAEKKNTFEYRNTWQAGRLALYNFTPVQVVLTRCGRQPKLNRVKARTVVVKLK